MYCSTRRAFTLLELLVVVSIITVLIAMLLPALGKARERVRQANCAGNLNQIGKGFLTYAAESGSFPLVPPPRPSNFGKWHFPALAAGAPDPRDPITALYSTPYLEPGDPLANEWVLVLTGIAQPQIFICPSDPTLPPAAETFSNPPIVARPEKFLNFGAFHGLPGRAQSDSYAFAYPWINISPIPAPWWRSTMQSSMPIAADIGPSSAAPADDPNAAPGSSASNSKNHAGTGQNVLYQDGHVTFEHGNNVGVAGDNIYTGDGGNIVVENKRQMFNTTTHLNAGHDVILVPARP